jgi:hypothetical protein
VADIDSAILEDMARQVAEEYRLEMRELINQQFGGAPRGPARPERGMARRRALQDVYTAGGAAAVMSFVRMINRYSHDAANLVDSAAKARFPDYKGWSRLPG